MSYVGGPAFHPLDPRAARLEERQPTMLPAVRIPERDRIRSTQEERDRIRSAQEDGSCHTRPGPNLFEPALPKLENLRAYYRAHHKASLDKLKPNFKSLTNECILRVLNMRIRDVKRLRDEALQRPSVYDRYYEVDIACATMEFLIIEARTNLDTCDAREPLQKHLSLDNLEKDAYHALIITTFWPTFEVLVDNHDSRDTFLQEQQAKITKTWAALTGSRNPTMKASDVLPKVAKLTHFENLRAAFETYQTFWLMRYLLLRGPRPEIWNSSDELWRMTLRCMDSWEHDCYGTNSCNFEVFEHKGPPSKARPL